MRHELRRRLEESGYSRPGFPERYDAVRPRPPAVLLELLPQLAAAERPRLVVDLGSGTGLSTRFWAQHADEVVGVEPNADMRRWAEERTNADNVRYLEASSYETGLPDACADLVGAAQSLQWMDPEPAFAEIARILRPGGVFCAYEYFALQTPLWEPEAAYEALRANVAELRRERNLDEGKRLWPVSRERLEASGAFRFVRELAAQSVEEGDGERLVGFALSEGSLTTLLEAGVREDQVGLDRLREVAAHVKEPVPSWISYRVWVGSR